MIPSLLLTHPALTYVAERVYMRTTRKHKFTEDEGGQVLWDYLLEQNLVPERLDKNASNRNQTDRTHDWFLFDAIQTSVCRHQWGNNIPRGSRMPEARKLLNNMLNPAISWTPRTGDGGGILRHGCVEAWDLIRLAQHFYTQQLTIFGHACYAGGTSEPYSKAVMAYSCNGRRSLSGQAQRRLNLILQLREHLPEPYTVALDQGTFRL